MNCDQCEAANIEIGSVFYPRTTARLTYLGDRKARVEVWHPERSATGGSIPANQDPTGNGKWLPLTGKLEIVELTGAQLAVWR